MEDFKIYLEKIIQHPYMSLVLGLGAVFLAKFTELIASALLGFLLGVYVVLPKVVEYFPKLQEWLNDPLMGKVAIAVAGVVSGAVVYALFKLFVFFATFSVSALIMYYILSMLRGMFGLDDLLRNSLGFDPEWIYIAISAGVGVWVGFIAQRRERDIFAVFSIIVGAFILSVAASYLVFDYFGVSDPLGFIVRSPGYYVVLGIFALLVVVGLFSNFKKKERVKAE